MRWCSRCVAGATSAALGGSGRLTCVVVTRSRLEQPASSNAKSAGAISRRAADPGPDACVERLTTPPIRLRSKYLNLLGTGRLHPGSAPLIDPSANAQPAHFQCLGRQPGCGKHPLVALGDRDCEVLRPPASEIHIDRGAAFAHRQNPALDERELAALF